MEYSKHKVLDTKGCESLLLQALKDHKSLKRQEITRLLEGVLSDQLTASQRKNKIDNLLRKMKKEGLIINKGVLKSSYWELAEV